MALKRVHVKNSREKRGGMRGRKRGLGKEVCTSVLLFLKTDKWMIRECGLGHLLKYGFEER